MEDKTKFKSYEMRMLNSSKWTKLFFLGVITYAAGVSILSITGNPNLFPAVVMLGNFLIPVTYVAFFYEKRTLSNVSMTNTIGSFFYGGFLGTFAAAIFEPIFIYSYNLGLRESIFIGIIEEATKIIGVFAILREKKHKLELDGIILGAAAGMGFAALESSGYAFTMYLRTGGNISAAVYTTLLRGILSPLGHGTWTAILGGIILREKGTKPVKINFQIIYAYVLVVILHALWDWIPSVISYFTSSAIGVLVGEGLVGATGLLILYKIWFEAYRQVIHKTL